MQRLQFAVNGGNSSDISHHTSRHIGTAGTKPLHIRDRFEVRDEMPSISSCSHTPPRLDWTDVFLPLHHELRS